MSDSVKPRSAVVGRRNSRVIVPFSAADYPPARERRGDDPLGREATYFDR
ncbi:hypothetical protein HSB1_29830 [Halogranum salarium B-1]|uniref:Uncharacterized protein n=1 Tax=Halogranum salarium B-1 TaxID=1210908 RepID=J2ZCV6_9EURY|nr:hypothetical protein HSB1_29830 [Halogranum salarium B-1]